MKKKEWLSIPNIMGYLRLVLAVVYLILTLNAETTRDYYMAAIVIGVSMLTDFLDGKIARRFHMVTNLGKVLDPFADKVTLGLIALSFIWRYPLMELVLLLFVVKEAFMLIAGMLLMRHGWKTSGATMYGKVCTATMYLVGFLLLGLPDMPLVVVNSLLLIEMIVMVVTLLSYIELYLQIALCFRQGIEVESIDWDKLTLRRAKRHKWIRRGLLIAGICFVIYVVVGATVPYRMTPKVTNTTDENFAIQGFTSNTIGNDRATIIEDNEEALEVRLQMIAHSKERVILSTFDFRLDESGKDVLSALYHAAERGVQVELFADGFNSYINMEGSPYFMALSCHPNAKIILYNKVSFLRPWTIMGRMHDKYLLVDDTAYVLGGRNTFDYFLGSSEGHKNYDRDILVYNTGSTDSSLYDLISYYENITSLECCSTFYDDLGLTNHPSVKRAERELRKHYEKLVTRYPDLFTKNYEYEKNTCETNTVRILKNPTHTGVKEPVVYAELMALAAQAKNNVTIHMPYVIGDEDMYESLYHLGHKVTFMFNSAANNSNLFAAVDYMTHKEDIVNSGVTILEYEGGVSYHGKSIVIDDNLSLIGSFNMDMRSMYINTELMVVVDSTKLNHMLREKMAKYEADAMQVQDVDTYASIPNNHSPKEVSSKKTFVRTFFGWLFEKVRFLM